MSLFRRPKKTAQRRVFSYEDHDSDSENDSNDYNTFVQMQQTTNNSNSNSKSNTNDPTKLALDKSLKTVDKIKKYSLLSFDDEDEGEVFQVKKSAHSKKVMKQLDKERKKRKHKQSSTTIVTEKRGISNSCGGELMSPSSNVNYLKLSHEGTLPSTPSPPPPPSVTTKCNATEVVLDDFVLRVKNVETDPIILNGRAALCAGKNDLTSDEEANGENSNDNNVNHDKTRHRFVKPDNFKSLLESGAIPDAAMIHAARKRRQRAREQGEFILLEEQPQIDNGKGRFLKDNEDDGSDNERVDMSAINGAKEIAERREQFYAIQDEYDESDPEINEWENQQLRKGVTGAQIASAQQDSALYSQYLNKQLNQNQEEIYIETSKRMKQNRSKIITHLQTVTTIVETGTNTFDGSSQPKTSKINCLRKPDEVKTNLAEGLILLRQLHLRHKEDIVQIDKDLHEIGKENESCESQAPLTAEKYRYYQELRGFMIDLIECLDEKIPLIEELEKRAIGIMSKKASYIIKRRHQDVRDQAQEISEAGKPGAVRKMLDDEDRVRRAADREGRRTRRRQIREKMDINNAHMDGMSSDDEIHQDHESAMQKSQLKQILDEANTLFDDTTHEFSEMPALLERFEQWRIQYMKTYEDVYFNLCLPKILGPMIRIHLITWNPLLDNCQDIERMDWYKTAIKYGWATTETESSLYLDPDCQLIPILIEKIILPKLTELIETCWDPLSTTQVLRLVGLIRRLGYDYPTLKTKSKYMQTLFNHIVQKMKLSLENDVFIPIYTKQIPEAVRSSFFQRQFSSALKLFRNLLSWQGIISDTVLKELAITSLLNRYFLPALRVCSPLDGTAKAYIIVNTMPRVWLQRETGIIGNLELFIQYLRHMITCFDKKNPLHLESIEKIMQILHSLHSTNAA